MLAYYSDFVQDQLDDVQARLQNRVATFLQLKSSLTQLKQSADSNIASKGAALYTRQVSLEGLLTTNMDKLKKIQMTGLSMAALPDIASIANFANAMETQINDVENLSNQSRGVPTTTRATLTSSIKPVAIFFGIGIAGFIAYKALK